MICARKCAKGKWFRRGNLIKLLIGTPICRASMLFVFDIKKRATISFHSIRLIDGKWMGFIFMAVELQEDLDLDLIFFFTIQEENWSGHKYMVFPFHSYRFIGLCWRAHNGLLLIIQILCAYFYGTQLLRLSCLLLLVNEVPVMF